MTNLKSRLQKLEQGCTDNAAMTHVFSTHSPRDFDDAEFCKVAADAGANFDPANHDKIVFVSLYENEDGTIKDEGDGIKYLNNFKGGLNHRKAHR